MRATTQGQHNKLAQRLQRYTASAIEAGTINQTVDAVDPDGTVTIEGQRRANFGSCSYLGLWGHPELKKAATAGIEQFGVSFSSSRMYAALPHYGDLESKLTEIMGARTIATGSTTLGHLSALPAIVTGDDAVVIDRQAHASLHLATQVLAARGIPVHPSPHADTAEIEAMVEDLKRSHDRIWFVGDGVYSMFGDIGPNAEIIDMLDRQPQMCAYIDDAHGFGWAGPNGRGVALGDRPVHPRLVLAVSLSKAFGAGGGAVVVGDDYLADQVAFRGGPLMFGGPIQTAELAAGVAAADLLLSPDYDSMQQALHDQIAFVADRARAHGVRMSSWASTPIWFAHVGPFDAARNVARKVMDAGYWVNLSAFPVVPLGRAGIRFTNTLSNTEDQIDGLLSVLSKAIRDELGEEIVIDLNDLDAAV